MPNGYVPETAPVQEFWSNKINGKPLVFEDGSKITVLRNGVPKTAKDVKEGICCVYFVKGDRHFLVMVSERKLMKMEATLGTGRDRTPATNHAKTLLWGVEAAGKRKGVGKFRKVDACFGFWFDVDRKDGVVYKFRSCANYFNAGHSTRQLAKAEETRLMDALKNVSAIPRDRQTDRDASDGNQLVGKRIAFVAKGILHKCEVIDFSGGKYTVRYKDGRQKKHELKDIEYSVLSKQSKDSKPSGQKKRKATESPGPKPSGQKKHKTPAKIAPQCQGIIKTTGDRCPALPSEWEWEDSRYCGRHQRQADCLARVKANGLQCLYKHKDGSRWCGVHFSGWHGKKSPKW